MRVEKFDRMLKKAVIVDDLNKREKYLNLYKKTSEFTISSLFVRFLGYSIFGIPCLIIFEKKLIVLLVLILLFILIDRIFGKKLDFRIGLREKVKQISKNNSPLFCFESRILKVETRKEDFFNMVGRTSWQGWQMDTYITLEDDIEFSINEYQYKEIKEKKIENVKIYFFEELLEPTPYYGIEFDE